MRHPQQETLPVPALDSPYRLGDEDVASFRRNGFVHLRGVATPSELEALGPSIEATALAQNLQKQPLDQRDTYGRAFMQVINLWLSDARVHAFVLAPRFARIAAAGHSAWRERMDAATLEVDMARIMAAPPPPPVAAAE